MVQRTVRCTRSQLDQQDFLSNLSDRQSRNKLKNYFLFIKSPQNQTQMLEYQIEIEFIKIEGEIEKKRKREKSSFKMT